MAGKLEKQETKFPRKAVPLELVEGDSDEVIARKKTVLLTSSETAAMRVMQGADLKTGNWDSIDVPSLIDQLRDQAAAVNRGDLSQAEAMLMNQATALQSLFARLAERGMNCEQVVGFEANMRMALRAQSQCRATLETLAEIKYPKAATFVRQQNVAYQQQVNNAETGNNTKQSAHAPAHGETENKSNELLEDQHEQRLDTGTTGAAIGADKELETVGAINRR